MRGLGEALAEPLLDGIGVWFLAIIATLLLPCLPLMVEWVRDGHIEATDTVCVTAAVLSATFIFTAEHRIYLGLYMILFGVSILVDTVGASSPTGLYGYAGTLR